MFLRGTLQAQRAMDWCSQRGTLQTQMLNEATDGLAPSVLDSFSGAARAASYEFLPVSEEDPRRETPGSDSHLAPEAWCSRKGTLQAQRAEDRCRPINVQRGYRRVGTVGFCHFSGAVIVDSRAVPPTSEERPEARHHGFGFASCSRGLVFLGGDIVGTNFNTAFDPSLEYSTDKVVLLAAPILFFTVVPFAVCRGRRTIFLRGAAHDGRKDQVVARPSSSGAHHVVASSKHTQTNRSRRAQL